MNSVLILGATGRTGSYVLSRLLHDGYHVHALVRNSKRLTISGDYLTVSEGSSTDPRLVNKLLSGSPTVLNLLNISRTSDFPWSPLRSPKDLISSTMRTVLEQSPGNLRIITCSAFGVNESEKLLPWWFSWTVNNSNIKFPYQDHARQEQILEVTSHKWTIVQPVGLTNSKAKKKVTVSDALLPSKPGLTISRRSLADFFVDAIGQKELHSKKVIVWT